MQLTPARIRAILLPALLVAGLFGASSVSAAEDPAAAPTATIAGTGVLAAHGDGHARLAGSYILTGSIDGGTITIRGIDRWSVIRATGWNAKTASKTSSAPIVPPVRVNSSSTSRWAARVSNRPNAWPPM